jgi:hypothetical protein
MTETTEKRNVQVAPWPTALEEFVAKLVYRPGWRARLDPDCVRDPATTHGAEGRGLTLIITTNTQNSYPPHEWIGVNHYFPVPPATYNAESWRDWLFGCYLLVERHECMEWFTIDGEKPYAPNHGPGWSPYLVTVVATGEDRRTSFDGILDKPNRRAAQTMERS